MTRPVSRRIEAILSIYRYCKAHDGRLPMAAFCGPTTYRELTREVRELLVSASPDTFAEDDVPRWITIGGVNHYCGPGRVGYRFYYGGPVPLPGETGMEHNRPVRQPDPIHR